MSPFSPMIAHSVALMLGSLSSSGASTPDLTNEYELNVRLDPSTGSLSADGTMTIIADAAREHVDLLLNKALRVDYLSCTPSCRVEDVPNVNIGGTPLVRTQQLRLTPASPLAAGDRLRISLRYAGTIGADDIEIGRGVVSPDWTEMSMGPLWYPIWFDEPMVRSKVTVRLPDGYHFVAPGQVNRLPSGAWRAIVDTPGVTRVSFAAGRDWAVQERPIDRRRRAILYTAVPEERGTAILASVTDSFQFYRTLFGTPRGPAIDLRVLYANRVTGLKYPREAYATGGSFIVLDESSSEVQRDTIHHEVAHLWFSAGRPGSPDEFLSESVSEYLAMRQGERVWGPGWLANKRRITAERSARVQGSVLAIDGFSATRQSLLYDRGSTALWLLQDRVGVQAMDRLLRQAHVTSTSTMTGFLELLAREHGLGTAEWFRNML